MDIDEALSRYSDDEIMAAFCNRQRSVVVAWVPNGVDGMPGMMQCSYRITKSDRSSPFEVEGLAEYLRRRAVEAVDNQRRAVAQDPRSPT